MKRTMSKYFMHIQFHIYQMKNIRVNITTIKAKAHIMIPNNNIITVKDKTISNRSYYE